jgi:hypothetical protein
MTQRKNRPFQWILIATFVVALFLIPHPAHAQTSSATSKPADVGPSFSESSGVDELIRVLLDNGTIGKEQAVALMEKKGQPGFSSLSALTELLKSKGVITQDDADRVAKKAASAPPVTLSYKPTQEDLDRMAEHVTEQIAKDVREEVKADLKQEVLDETKKEVQAAAAPEWTKRIRFGGDIRLRYEGDFFSTNNALFLNPASPTTLLNSQTEQDRFRVRARLGADAEVVDNVEAVIRFTTGDTQNPVTSQITTGNYFNKYGVVLDLAYLKFTPVSGLTIIGGRVPNPWIFTDLVWWRDLTFDGLTTQYKMKLNDMFSPFLTAGAYPLQYVGASLSTQDKYLFAGQTGFDVRPTKDLSGKFGVAYYDYVHTQGIANTPAFPDQYDYTAPQFEQKGNTIFDIQPSGTTPLFALASNYRELDVTGVLDIAFWKPVHVLLTADYVTNLGFDQTSVERLTGVSDVPKQVNGYLAGITVGYPEIKNRWDWRIWGYYKYLEADAVLDAFTDDDFHLGGTNAKGWVVGGDLGIGRNLWASVKYVSTNEIKGPPFAIDSLFVDLNCQF